MSPLSQEIEAAVERVLSRMLPQLTAGEPRKLLSVAQAGARIGRSAAAIRHLINSGQIPARVVKRMGKRVFVIASEFDSWIDAQ